MVSLKIVGLQEQEYPPSGLSPDFCPLLRRHRPGEQKTAAAPGRRLHDNPPLIRPDRPVFNQYKGEFCDKPLYGDVVVVD